MENTLNLAFPCSILASMSVKYQYQFGFLNPKPILPRNPLTYAHKSTFETGRKGAAGQNFCVFHRNFEIGISGSFLDRNIRWIRISGPSSDRNIRFGGLSRLSGDRRGEDLIRDLLPPPTASFLQRRRLPSPHPSGDFLHRIWCSTSPGIFSSKQFLKWMRVTLTLLNLGCFVPFNIVELFVLFS